MLDYSSRILVSRGFKQPTSFRAGGWSAGQNVLAALSTSKKYRLDPTNGTIQLIPGRGYLVDSSAVWPVPIGACAMGQQLYPTLMDSQGISSNTTQVSQPYWTQNGTLLEAPDNGVLVDYQSGCEMLDTLNKNGVVINWNYWNLSPYNCSHSPNSVPSSVQLAPRMVQFGFHPHTFVGSNAWNMEIALEGVDDILYAADRGPAVFAKISDLAQVLGWASTPN